MLILKTLVRLFSVLLFATIVVGILSVRIYRVYGDSDAPALVSGDYLVVNRLAYDFRIPFLNTLLYEIDEPTPGDFVVIHHRGLSSVMTKRIVAGPGQTVELVNNRLRLDGLDIPYEAPLDEEVASIPARERLGESVWYELAPHGPRIISFSPDGAELGDYGPVTLGEGEFLVLGDNRDESSDSREFGPVHRDEISGQVVGLFRNGKWIEIAPY